MVIIIFYFFGSPEFGGFNLDWLRFREFREGGLC